MVSDKNPRVGTRRTWLALAGSMGLLGLVSALWLRFRSKEQGLAVSPDGTEELRLLRKTYPYLEFSDEDARTYIADHRKAERDSSRRKRRNEDEFVTIFLLSTNFFQSGGKTPAKVQYVAYWDPEHVPCQQPFARFD